MIAWGPPPGKEHNLGQRRPHGGRQTIPSKGYNHELLVANNPNSEE